jgi:hypothetical protein
MSEFALHDAAYIWYCEECECGVEDVSFLLMSLGRAMYLPDFPTPFLYVALYPCIQPSVPFTEKFSGGEMSI